MLGGVLQMVVVAGPIVASFGSAIILSRALPSPRSLPANIVWWVVVLGGSLVVLLIVERLLRRLSPLAVLLKMAMAFPDQAPSRFRVARQSGNVRRLKQRMSELPEGEEDVPSTAAETILALATALTAHDRSTRGHSERVRAFTDMLADEMRITRDDRDRLRWAALLHDIGKLTVPSKILNKKGSLNRREWEVIHRHPEEGMRFIAPLVPWLGRWARTVKEHHERLDGRGYPSGLRSTEISLGARIVAVADAYDTMTAARSYKRPMSATEARVELTEYAEAQFDPEVVRALLSISIGRLWRRIGVVSWMAQFPILGRIPQLLSGTGVIEEGAAMAMKGAATVATLGLAGAVVSGAHSRSPADAGHPRTETGVVRLATEGTDSESVDAGSDAPGASEKDGGGQKDGSDQQDQAADPAGDPVDAGGSAQVPPPGQDSIPHDPGSGAPGSGGSGGGGQGEGPSGSTPGQSGTTPGQSGTTPGPGSSPPGQSGTAPGQSGSTPGQDGTTPGQGPGGGSEEPPSPEG